MALIATHKCIKCGAVYYNHKTPINLKCKCGGDIKRINPITDEFIEEEAEKYEKNSLDT